MSLLESMLDACVFLEKARTPDGEGGYITTWAEGAELKAAITLNTTIEARVAEAQGIKNIYTITTNKNTLLEYHDVIKRVRDGAIFRVTGESKDKTSPTVAALDMAQVSAEKWSLT